MISTCIFKNRPEAVGTQGPGVRSITTGDEGARFDLVFHNVLEL